VEFVCNCNIDFISHRDICIPVMYTDNPNDLECIANTFNNNNNHLTILKRPDAEQSCTEFLAYSLLSNKLVNPALKEIVIKYSKKLSRRLKEMKKRRLQDKPQKNITELYPDLKFKWACKLYSKWLIDRLDKSKETSRIASTWVKTLIENTNDDLGSIPFDKLQIG